MNLYGASTGTGSTANTFLTSTNLATEFKPYYAIQNTNYGVVYDIAVIRMCDIFMKKFSLLYEQIRLYFDTLF